MATQKSEGIVLNRRTMSYALMVLGLILGILGLVTQTIAVVAGGLAVLVIGFLFYRRTK